MRYVRIESNCIHSSESFEFVYGIESNYLLMDGHLGISNQIIKELYDNKLLLSPIRYIQTHIKMKKVLTNDKNVLLLMMFYN